MAEDGSIHSTVLWIDVQDGRPAVNGADAHVDRLAKEFIGADSYLFRQPGEQHITYVIEPTSVRHQEQ